MYLVVELTSTTMQLVCHISPWLFFSKMNVWKEGQYFEASCLSWLFFLYYDEAKDTVQMVNFGVYLFLLYCKRANFRHHNNSWVKYSRG